MFDQPKLFSESFQEGEEFVLEAIKVGNPIGTEYGTKRAALLKIGGEWYSAFGEGLLNQVERQDASDLPAKVVLGRVATKGGQEVKLLIPAGEYDGANA